ncbi:MAG: hypothetical protein V1887_04460 [Candidatus Aenigmatarchaeota archaeon]
MKGYVFTLTTFLIFMGLISYFSAFVTVAKERTTIVNDQIAAERTWRSWLSVASGVAEMANVSFTKSYGTAEINDTLPAEKNVSGLLDLWQNAIKIYSNDASISNRFQDASGNEVELGSNSLTNVMITPVGVNYTWPNWQKNQSTIRVTAADFANIERIDLNIRTKQTLALPVNIWWQPNISNPSDHICTGGTAHCLLLNLTVTDGTNRWNSTGIRLDADKITAVEIDLQPGSARMVNVTVGPLPNLLNVKTVSGTAHTNTKIVLNTASFYTNFMARLNVTSPFGRKVTAIGLSVWKTKD